jgi:4-hydroxy-3-polyprenylbenzoate decarboxylase
MEKIFEITAVTQRAAPIYQGIISEFPPSESTVIRKAAFDAIYLNHLRNVSAIASVSQVASHEAASCNMMFVIQLNNPAPGDAKRALHAAARYDPSLGKVLIAVDADVDPDSMDAVLWALSYSMQPHRDVEIIGGKIPRLDPSVTPGTEEASAMLINACREHPYLPVSLPRRDLMEKARARWQALGLPALDLKAPWHGYRLTQWTDENADEAEKAVTGRYFETGDKLARRRGPP